ncbi:MAG: SDR family oxidoreductase [Telmatospirillum sp.]|nr:SDR family oxidoreductase [Telmatospirillum sp.]
MSHPVPSGSSPLPLAGRTVAVIGGSSGIGRAVAATARANGARLLLVARDPSRLAEAAAALGGARTIAADIADPAWERSDPFRDIAIIDHLIITAGTVRLRPLAEQTAEDLRRIAAERFTGPLLAIASAVRRMPADGSITLTSGQIAARPLPVGVALAAAAGAVEAMTPALALELAPRRVNAVAPGMVDTPLLAKLLGDGRDAAIRQAASTLPAGRIAGDADVAAAILLLITNGAITGEVLHVDGGGRWV